ncbi:MAG: N-acetylmuramoyl-L-alanine amidase [Gammaproteobacteria bacterium]|nr:MAG: N-acetylmuramoyl-L-alanine amidase [Gammaproteobacteria bacterium]
MIRKIFREGFAAGVIGLGALSLGSSLGSAAELRAVELSASDDGAQLTLDLSEGAQHKLFTLEHPDRVVVDLPNTHLADGVRAPGPEGVVTEVRFGAQPDGTLRVVAELKSALPAHSGWAPEEEGHRLILTLGEPAAAAQAPPKTVRAPHAPREGDRDVIIAVDAGHGGEDPGAIGRGGTREKDVTLAIARALAQRIDAEPGMRAVLTRDRDEFLELRERIRRAHAAHADMFISVHADSIRDRSVSGASVYVLSVHGASSEAARWLAERENAADLAAGARRDDQSTLEPVLIDAAQNQIIGVSASAAERVMSALEGVGEVRKAQVQRAGFVVLKSRDIPSMLIETAYISNPAEERRLRSAREQARFADAIAGGLRSYFTQNPPDGTRFKQEHRGSLVSAGGAALAATP